MPRWVGSGDTQRLPRCFKRMRERRGLCLVIVVGLIAACCNGILLAVPPDLPPWPDQYETIISDFHEMVAADHRRDLARDRLQNAIRAGGRCDPCQQEMVAARVERDRLMQRLGERLEGLLAQREEELRHLGSLAQNLRTAGQAPRRADLESLLGNVRQYRELLDRHQALGEGFKELADGVAKLGQRLVGHLSQRPRRLGDETAESLERAAGVLRAIARQAFRQLGFCRDWIKTMDRDAVDSGELATLYAALQNDALVKTLGKSSDLLSSLPEALRQQMRESLEREVILETSYEPGRGRIYRAVVEVRRRNPEPLEDTKDLAKGLAAAELQLMIDHTITRLESSRTGPTALKATFFHCLEQRVEFVTEQKVRASAEAAERDIFPLIPLPDLVSLGFSTKSL